MGLPNESMEEITENQIQQLEQNLIEEFGALSAQVKTKTKTLTVCIFLAECQTLGRMPKITPKIQCFGEKINAENFREKMASFAKIVKNFKNIYKREKYLKLKNLPKMVVFG